MNWRSLPPMKKSFSGESKCCLYVQCLLCFLQRLSISANIPLQKKLRQYHKTSFC